VRDDTAARSAKGPMTILLTADHVRSIEASARETYPEECCGILIGVWGEPKRVLEVRRTPNVAASDRGQRYVIDPTELVAASAPTGDPEREIIGFYHSHPDSPSRPSEVDRGRATWPGHSYVIVAVLGGVPHDITSWQMDGATGFVQAEPLQVIAPSD